MSRSQREARNSENPAKELMAAREAKNDSYWPVPKEYGPNYQHNLAKSHFSEGGQAENKHARSGKWIQGAIHHPGALHEALKVPKGQKIPEMKLERAAHSSSPLMRKRANLALTLKGFHHKG